MARAHWVGAAAGAAAAVMVACLAGAAADDAWPRQAVGRHQISAESNAGGRVWMVDTATGQVWWRAFNGGPEWQKFGSPVEAKGR